MFAVPASPIEPGISVSRVNFTDDQPRKLSVPMV